MWMILNKSEKPDNYIICTEDWTSIKEFAEESFKEAGF